MTKRATLKVTRAELVQIASRLTKRYRSLTPEQVTALTHAAETAPAVMLNTWRHRDCGCLVGTAYPELFTTTGAWRDLVRDQNVLLRLGISFDGELRKLLHPQINELVIAQDTRWPEFSSRVKVVD